MGDPTGSRDERAGHHMPKKPAHRVDEEPVLRDGLSVEEECRTGLGLGEEVGRGDGKPLEDGETGARLEHEHRNSLLDEQADDDRRPFITDCQQTLLFLEETTASSPWDVIPVPRRCPEEELEDEKPEDGDRTVAVGGAL